MVTGTSPDPIDLLSVNIVSRVQPIPICHPETAMYTMNAIFIGGIALALKRAVKWDPARLEFPGDTEANRLLSYATRPPWLI